MIRTALQQEISELTLTKSDYILNNLQAIDLGLRGYAITQDKNHYKHYLEATQETSTAFNELAQLLQDQHFEAIEFYKLKKAMLDYHTFCNGVVKAIDSGNQDLVKELISQDKGYEAWSLYQTFFKKLSAFEKKQSQQAQQEYDQASSSSIWIMGILLIIGVPTLGTIVYLLRSAEKKRRQLFFELEQNNRRYNFNSGEPIDIQHEYQLINGYIENSKKAAHFVNQVANGSYNVHWEDLNENNQALNQENLAGALIKMRDQMKQVKDREEKRLWATRGIADFSELIRNHQENIQELTYQSLVFLVKYLNAQQGGFFVVATDNHSNKYLELSACYAFERKKQLHARIELGEGIAGQALQEGETILMTDVPQGYTKITSGQGGVTPTCILAVPMRFNHEVQVVLELASFTVYEPYQIEFIEKAGDVIASAIASTRANDMTGRLLMEAQQKSEELRAQEEEMRQQLEELSATQEEMHRKEREFMNKIAVLENKLAVQASL